MKRLIRKIWMLTGLILCVLLASGQSLRVTISGTILDEKQAAPIPYTTITLHKGSDTAVQAITITNEKGIFTLTEIAANSNYTLAISHSGYQAKKQSVWVGQMSSYLDLGKIPLSASPELLSEVVIAAKQDAISSAMDKKTYSLSNNLGATGGSVLDAMKNLPGISVSIDGKIQLRGSEKLVVLIDGKQTALTGFGSPGALENIPASAIEKVEIINNPSSRYDANGSAGIVNIIYRKEKKEGFNGKVGLIAGLGALWVKKENYPGIDPQYTRTPKLNPSLSLNYRKNKLNVFLQADDLYNETLNKNEFVTRYYDDGTIIKQQTRRNRNTNTITGKTGIDWMPDTRNTFQLSGLFSSEKIIDHGEQPFYTEDLKDMQRLWQFLEDELKTTANLSATWQHKFLQPGRSLQVGFLYSFHREDEKYFFTNINPAYTGQDSFKLLSDEHVADLNIDYVQPLRRGRFETGFKFRRRFIPVDMHFKPGINSPLDSTAGGWAHYGETIPAVYGNYIFESKFWEAEAGLRLEYVAVEYDVNPTHPVYKSDGYTYFEPFPTLRLAYKFNDRNKISFFYNRRVDRPNEVDIRIFPKYDDAEIIKVGNPALQPQFSNNYELSYKRSWSSKGSLMGSFYHKRVDGTIVRIGSMVPGSYLIYNIFQNAGKSYQTGLEFVFSQPLSKWFTLSLNANGYHNIIDSFTVVNKYPVENIFTAPRTSIYSGIAKLNAQFRFSAVWDGQLTAIYQAPDLLPQGKVYSRFGIDIGLKRKIQKGRGELFFNATDIANTMRLKREVTGDGFHYVSTDYNETQVFRIGYTYTFGK